jgi:hypothetical protein
MMQEREDSEDTISYKSDSDDYSDTDQTMIKQIMPKGQVYTHTNDMAVSYAPNFKFPFPQKIDISPHKPSMDHTTDVPDLPGVPRWFPARIKRILNDDGCPDALPFKVSNYGAQLRTFPLTAPSSWINSQDTEHGLRLFGAEDGNNISGLGRLGGN